MSTFKKAKVVMLPTNNKEARTLNLSTDVSSHYQHLYFTSNDEIKEGDWFIWSDKVFNEFKVSITPDSTIWIRIYPWKDLSEQWQEVYKLDCKKIIATTDASLIIKDKFELRSGKNAEYYPIEYNLPQPSQRFIQKYIKEYNKGNIITDVMVEYTVGLIIDKESKTFDQPDIIKVNPKDNTITIKAIKDSFSRDEVIKLFNTLHNDICSTHPHPASESCAHFDLKTFIKKHL